MFRYAPWNRSSRPSINRGHRIRQLRHEQLEVRRLLTAAPVTTFVAGEILVGFEGDVATQFRLEGPGKALQSAAAIYGGWGLQEGKTLMHLQEGPAQQERLITRWKLPPGRDVQQVASELADLPGVAYAEPNYLVSIASTPSYPDDTKFSSLWGMDNTGQTGGTPDADIDAPEAWGIHTGSGNVVVGIIDSGVNYNHADLAPNIWTNLDERDGIDGVDDDGNGFIDDVHGWDFINSDSDPMDDNGHGTHVAGTIGAVGNNGTGVVGVNWNVQIMPLKFIDRQGQGTTAAAIESVNYVTMMRRDHDVNVVLTNNSYRIFGDSQALYDAIAASGQANMLFVAAAGNYGNENVSIPARYDLDNIISVAATDHNDELADFSSYGKTQVDLAAPGEDIYSTINKNYRTMSGTSMASPHVAGAAALVWDYLAENGIAPNYQTVRDCLFVSGDRIPATSHTVSTGSRLNVHNALRCAAALAGQATRISVTDVSVVEGDSPDGTTVRLTVTRSGIVDARTELDWSTASDTASAGSDYIDAGDHLVFNPGEVSRQILVDIGGDTVIEPNETFQVVLSNVTNRIDDVDVDYFVSGRPACVTITNDDFGLVPFSASWCTLQTGRRRWLASGYGARGNRRLSIWAGVSNPSC